MIEDILPDKVCCAESFDDSADVTLFPEEAVAISKAVDKRRNEFATVRHCARKALACLGYPAVPLIPGERGAPQWPDGVSGSMTHCAGYRAAAVAHRTDIASLGIDAEPHAALPDGVLGAIARPEEQRTLERLARAAPGTHWDRLLFSAKESVYKTWFPLTRSWLGFEDATLTIDPYAGTFRADILATSRPPLHEFHGRWLAHDGLVITAVAHPAT